MQQMPRRSPISPLIGLFQTAKSVQPKKFLFLIVLLGMQQRRVEFQVNSGPKTRWNSTIES
jgi:hypothetical protein